MDHLGIILVLGLAAYRATQLVVWDTIFDPLRERISLWHANTYDAATLRCSRTSTFARQLISCVYCAGWWLSMITVLVYVTASGQWGHTPLWVIAVDAWAVAGVQALLNRWDDSRPGHRAGA